MSRPTPTQHRTPLSARPGARRAFLVTAAVLSTVLIVASGLAVAGIYYYDDQLVKVGTGEGCGDAMECLPDVDPECVRDACTYLLLGSDSRAGLTEGQEVLYGDEGDVDGQRADTIIVLHRDPEARRTVVLHVPRDLRVELPNGTTGKINSAYGEGPNEMVRAVESLTGLSINHFVSVNFVGFINLVNALGGVEICIDRPMVDTIADLRLPDAGCYDLQGRQALAFVRARHVQGDNVPDFSRIARQQQFIGAVINKLLSPGSTFRLPRLIEAAEDNLVVDEGLDLYELRDLTNELAEIGQEGVTFRVTPAQPVLIDGISYVELVEPRASELFERIRTGRYLGGLGKQEENIPLSPADVVVRVYDAGSGGQAEQVIDYLRRAGFAVRGPSPAPDGLSRTQLLYASGYGKQKAVVSSYLPLVPLTFENHPRPGADITVVIGADFEGITA